MRKGSGLAPADFVLAVAAFLAAAGLLFLFFLGPAGLQSLFGSFVGAQDVEAGKVTAGLLDDIHKRSLFWGLFFLVCSTMVLILRPVFRAGKAGWSIRGEWQSFREIIAEPLRERGTFSALVVILLAAFVFRILHLDRTMRYDEAYTWLSFVRRSPFIGLSYYSAPNNHLFHTLLAHLSVGLFGDSPAALRLPALISSLAVVPVLMALGSRLGAKKAGAAAAMLWAVSPMAISYSVNARGYTLTVLLFLLLNAAALAWVRGDLPYDKPPVFLMSLAAAAGMYTVPTFIIPLTGTALFLFFSLQDVRERKLIGLCVLITAVASTILYVPVFVVSGVSSLVANRFVVPGTFSSLFHALPAFPAALARQWQPAGPEAGIYLFASLVLIGVMLSGAGKKWRPIFLLVITQAASLLLFILVQRRIPYLRVYIYLLPLYFFAGALFLELLPGRKLFAVSALLLVCIGGLYEHRQGTVISDPDTGYLPEAQAVASWLDLELDDKRGVSVTYTPILEYYAQVYEYEKLDKALSLDRDMAESVYVVIDKERLADPGALLAGDGYNPKLFEAVSVPVERSRIRIETWRRVR